MNAKQTEQAEAIARLRGWLKPGDTVNCILRHVSRSGMQRRISFLVLDNDSQFILDRNIAIALDMREGTNRLGGHDGVVVGGCGMDMGFHVVYNLSLKLLPHGFGCIGEGGEHRSRRCPSNDHSNGDRSYAVHDVGEPIVLAEPVRTFQFKEGGTVHWHKDGGYALRHRWL